VKLGSVETSLYAVYLFPVLCNPAEARDGTDSPPSLAMYFDLI
jgi:hypothetical protein